MSDKRKTPAAMRKNKNDDSIIAPTHQTTTTSAIMKTTVSLQKLMWESVRLIINHPTVTHQINDNIAVYKNKQQN